jgi:protein TonB
MSTRLDNGEDALSEIHEIHVTNVTPFIDVMQNRANLRSWVISTAIAVLVHGAIVAGVVTWRQVMIPVEPRGPIGIELVPMPAAPPAEQAALPPTGEQVPSAVLPDEPIKNEEKAGEKATARSEDRAEPKPAEAPLPAAPPAQGENEADANRATGGGAASPLPAAGGAGAIDTRIALPPGLHSGKAAKANDWKKAIMARPSKNSGERQQPREPRLAVGARNAIGLLQQNPANGGTSAKGLNATDAAKNAVGAAAANISGGSATNADGTATSANGITVPMRTNASGANSDQPGIGPIASTSNTWSNAVVNGTKMVRPGSSAGVVGGAAKNLAGVINGTLIRPR